jgi:peptidoglycan/xylan/chitin deacetylase (PgdA/CDA1 family)
LSVIKPSGEGHKIYLTFDDGPSRNTGDVLDVLKSYNIRATFFVIGPDEIDLSLYDRILDEGHSMGLHSYSHNTGKIYASSDAYIEDFKKLRSFIFKQTGTLPGICRMVGGSNSQLCSMQTRKEILDCFSQIGYKCYDWDIDPKDSGEYALSAEGITENVIINSEQNPNQDLVILLHDDKIRKTLPEALKAIIPYFIEKGYEFGALSEDTVLDGSRAEVN